MRITSPAFMNGQPIPYKYAYHYDNLSPALEISGAPNEAVSFALIVHDPDAPAGDFTHWLMWNIQPTTVKFIEGTVPSSAVQGTNDFGNMRWDGPAPPTGIHHYHFVLYALDATLDVPAGAMRAELESALKGRVMGSAELIGTFSAQ